MSRLPHDAAARARALDAQSSFIVQAPAGSGKTELLTDRLLALLASVEEPEEIVAITFTRKAAAEMHGRVLAKLTWAREALARGESPDLPHQRTTLELARAALARDAERGWALLEHPARLRVLTIDALCASLARQMPYLSQLGGGFATAENAEELYAEAARATLADLDGDEAHSAALADLLRHLDNDQARAEGLIAGMLARRDQWLGPLLRAEDDPERLRAELEATLAERVADDLRALRRELPARRAEALLPIARYAGEQLAREASASPIAVLAEVPEALTGALEELPYWQGLQALLLKSDGLPRLTERSWNKNQGLPATAEGKAMKAALLEWMHGEGENSPFLALLAGASELPEPSYREGHWRVLHALFAVLKAAVARLWLLFQARGEVDFIEVAQRALSALGSAEEPTDLLLALDYRLRHLLVDEFQDTSLSQVALLERLTAGWQAGDGRSLFLVGDPMQSIYRFRKAEVSLFLAAQARGIGEVALEPLRLTDNFRSQAGIVDWVNSTFHRILPQADDLAAGAIRYSASTAFHPARTSPAVRIHPALHRDRRDSEAEAATVVTLVRAALAQGGNVAILARARSHLAASMDALKAAGIAFRAVDLESLASRQAVADILQLTRALLHPGDRLAWLSLLRAPWCGLTLNDLHALAGDAPTAAVWDLMRDTERRARLSRDGQARLERCMAQLAPALAERGRLPLAAWVEGVWQQLGGPATVDDPTRLADVARYLERLDELELSGRFRLDTLADEVAALYASPSSAPDAERVQLMTMHKSKGLQFHTVILPGLDKRPRHDDSPLLLMEDDALGLTLAPVKAGNEAEASPIYRYLQIKEAARAGHEAGRLLYVATTRAVEQLHLLGSVKVDEHGELKPPAASSLLARLWEGVEAEYAAALRDSPPPALDAEAALELTPQPLLRLPIAWARPLPAPALPPLAAPETLPEAAPAEARIKALDPARQVGTVVHAWLERLAGEELSAWDAERIAGERPRIRAQLRRLALAEALVDEACERVVVALCAGLSDPQGRWLLAQRDNARSEWALTSAGAELRQHLIDRSFVAEGVRFIVDYKTSRHEGAGREDFLAAQRALYRDQLERYAGLLRTLEARPIRLGLYYPLMGVLDTWDYPG